MEIEMKAAEIPLELRRPEMAKPKVSQQGSSKRVARGRRSGRRTSGRLAKQPPDPGAGEFKPRKDWKAELKRRLMAVDSKHFLLP